MWVKIELSFDDGTKVEINEHAKVEFDGDWNFVSAETSAQARARAFARAEKIATDLNIPDADHSDGF